MLTGHIGWRRVAPWLLVLLVLSAIGLGPLGLLSCIAGFLKSYLLYLLLLWPILVGWLVLLLMACRRFVQALRARRRTSALWSGMALGIVLAFALGVMGRTPCPVYFGHGLISRLELRTDIGAAQAWVESLDPKDCIPAPHSGSRGKYLRVEEQPQVLQGQDGMVHLELDAEGRPCVRLTWDESKAGMWGLVSATRTCKRRPSEPGMYGEKRTQLRPGVYFWYVEG